MKKTKRALFLEEMEHVIPWLDLYALTEPHYQASTNGRRAARLKRMLRVYFLQQWFNLSDDQVEDALYDSAVMRQFVGLDPESDPIPDESLVGNFRNFLERRALGEEIRAKVNQHLQNKGVRINAGTVIDARILHGANQGKLDKQ